VSWLDRLLIGWLARRRIRARHLAEARREFNFWKEAVNEQEKALYLVRRSVEESGVALDRVTALVRKGTLPGC
jgi:GH24 family phage-related lysozyme (muramidase)